MAGPNKDFPQVLKESYDPLQERIRVDAVVSDGIDSLVINPDGSINTIITDGTDTLNVNTDGSINVNVVSGSSAGVEKTFFSSISSVASGSETTILTYIVPLLVDSFLKRIEVSGSNIAVYNIYVDTVLIARKRTYFGSALNSDFDFAAGIKYVSGQTIEVKVLHGRPTTGDFEARLQVNEV